MGNIERLSSAAKESATKVGEALVSVPRFVLGRVERYFADIHPYGRAVATIAVGSVVTVAATEILGRDTQEAIIAGLSGFLSTVVSAVAVIAIPAIRKNNS